MPKVLTVYELTNFLADLAEAANRERPLYISILNLIKAGVLPARRIGKAFLVDVDDLPHIVARLDLTMPPELPPFRHVRPEYRRQSPKPAPTTPPRHPGRPRKAAPLPVAAAPVAVAAAPRRTKG